MVIGRLRHSVSSKVPQLARIKDGSKKSSCYLLLHLKEEIVVRRCRHCLFFEVSAISVSKKVNDEVILVL